ncbi:hypothetical protein CDL15_Pgr004969 [Punica granatum]|uniref:BED-type domain-containing protein n=1 Tax=Punica granatum TaxID=22663 RepID=A0A218WV97_PUNGR|nr:hypothetical protein CDL15_Pgr004969 [Punica granatum]
MTRLKIMVLMRTLRGKAVVMMRAFTNKKRGRTSTVWLEFKEEMIDGVRKVQCVHCHSHLSFKNYTTSHLMRHLETVKQKRYNVQQRINFPPAHSKVDVLVSGSAIIDGRYDMMKMREGIAHWISMHEHSFIMQRRGNAKMSIVEEEGFNIMQRRGNGMIENTMPGEVGKIEIQA